MEERPKGLPFTRLLPNAVLSRVVRRNSAPANDGSINEVGANFTGMNRLCARTGMSVPA